MNDWKHGTLNGYSNYRCRCTDCREAQRLYMQDYRARKREQRAVTK